jgi:hypothetical protein
MSSDCFRNIIYLMTRERIIACHSASHSCRLSTRSQAFGRRRRRNARVLSDQGIHVLGMETRQSGLREYQTTRMRLYLFVWTVSSRIARMTPMVPMTPIVPMALTWARPLGGTTPDSLSIPSRSPRSSHPIFSARSLHHTRRCTGGSSRLVLEAVLDRGGGG